MVLVSYSGREINAKLVYYGPGLSGKTTNLEYIYSAIPQGHRGKMVSMKTKTERTLFFDFLPIHLGELSGFKTRFLLYTVPGQVYYNATRKLVLKGVDAIVFVADSKRGKMDENIESLENLRANLREHGHNLDDLPWVIQYNKRDLTDVYSLEELERTLNPGKVPSFEAVATTGTGVFESFKTIARMLLKHLSAEIGVKVVASEKPEAPPAAPPQESQAPVAREASPPPPPPSSTPPPPPPAPAPEREASTGSFVTGPRALSTGEGIEEGEEDDAGRSAGMGDRLKKWFSRGRDPVESEEEETMARPGSGSGGAAMNVSIDLDAPKEEKIEERARPQSESSPPAPPVRPIEPGPAPGEEKRQEEPCRSEVPLTLSGMSPEPAAPSPEPGRAREKPPAYREVPILVDLNPEDLRTGVVLKLRIAVRSSAEEARHAEPDRAERAA